jgi:phage portal protein BeeE
MGRTAVLANGLDFKPLSINAVDSELVGQLRYVTEQIASVYRVPGFMLGDLNKVNFRNSETLAREYLSKCLSYHLTAFEQCFHKAFEMPDSVYVDLDERVLLRMETDTRYTAYQTALQAGFMSINEVRLEENLPPVKGGEEPRVQMQYVPLSTPVPTPAPAPTPAIAPPAPAPEPAPATPPKKTLTKLDLDVLSSHVTKSLWGSDDGT